MGRTPKINALRWRGGSYRLFKSSRDVPSGTDFSDLGEDDEFTWHQFNVEGWGAQDFKGHEPVVMHNATGQAVPLTWLLLDIQ